MPFSIIRNDIVRVRADAIVNSANPFAAIGAGVDEAIHRAAGEGLINARRRIGDIAVGEARATPAYRLQAKYVIHTVGPVWQGGGFHEQEAVKRCYRSSLELAQSLDCKSIAFPLISTGNDRFPKDQALRAAISVFGEYLLTHDMDVVLVVYDHASYVLSEKLMRGVSAFIDDQYIDEFEDTLPQDETFAVLRRQRRMDEMDTFEPPASRTYVHGWLDRQPPQDALLDAMECKACPQADEAFWEDAEPAAPASVYAATPKLDELMDQLDESFSQTLLRMIDRSGKTDVEVYKKANLDRKLFSKIRSKVDYRPSKQTALALAIALELDLDETKLLLQRAGFALSHSSKFDIIIEYFIREHNYNIFELNEVLFGFDQPLLGG